ncbi:SLC13 family permease [Chromobacterium haemolyticum]|uniref:SLC13 family permease n=1 Tax=Chromobacterium haemolyticum TaxID=394935 RepID=UPI002952EEBA|nr:SLC13 family permease [Chromobacterium haemolyticum]WON82183.1 SLC13 family permease [Chromobacterium haemolyticum]
MLTFAGLAIIVMVVSLLILRKLAPVVCLTLIPFIGALLAGFGFADIGKFYSAGLNSVIQVATMFIFAITFFGVMQDTGVFRPIVNGMVGISRGNVVTVAVCTAVVGMLAHLDGVGATTFLLTVPTLLPLYRRLGMNPYLMMLLLALGAGILNMMPWAGPLGRAAAVTDLDPAALWQPLIPLQLIGAGLLVVLAAVLGVFEARRLRKQGPLQATDDAEPLEDLNDKQPLPKLFFVNMALFLGVIGTLISGILPSGYIFMIGLGIALVINYPDVDEQLERIRAHAPNALLMGAIILAAGSFLGVLNGSGAQGDRGGSGAGFAKRGDALPALDPGRVWSAAGSGVEHGRLLLCFAAGDPGNCVRLWSGNHIGHLRAANRQCDWHFRQSLFPCVVVGTGFGRLGHGEAHSLFPASDVGLLAGFAWGGCWAWADQDRLILRACSTFREQGRIADAQQVVNTF